MALNTLMSLRFNLVLAMQKFNTVTWDGIVSVFGGLLTDWWAGIPSRPDWVITRKGSKLPLFGPRLLKLPFRQVILVVMHLGWGKPLGRWISCMKLLSGWVGEGRHRHLVISAIVCSLVLKTDIEKGVVCPQDHIKHILYLCWRPASQCNFFFFYNCCSTRDPHCG